MIPSVTKLTDSVSSDKVVAIVLGGGRGTRLYPLTRERAKPAVPVGGRYRLVDIPLSNCLNSGINRMFVLTQFNSRSLHRHINDSYKFDIFSRGYVEILAAEQTVERGDWFQGTADAIRQNLWHLKESEADYYLILSGDHLYRMDYSDFLQEHIDKKADISVATLPVNRHEARGFGVMNVDEDGRIVEFVEKPDTDELLNSLRIPSTVMGKFGFEATEGQEYLASMGVYVFTKEMLWAVLEDRPDWFDFGKHVIPSVIGTHNIHAYLFPGFWEDIGTVRSYYNVSMRLVQPNPPFEFLDPDRPIYTRARFLPGSRIHGATISDSIVCEGSQIQTARITKSIVGIRSIIKEGVQIRDSIVMGADYFDGEHGAHEIPLGIGGNTTIERAIVDKNARIGSNVVIRGREDLPDRMEETYAIVDGIVIILKNAVIPDGTVIG